jgi:hypothetical protein
VVDHYQPKKISSISKSDQKVVMVGKVLEVGENSFILEDDSGKAEIFSEESVEEGELIRVFCSS